jgi:hypothetical protein
MTDVSTYSITVPVSEVVVNPADRTAEFTVDLQNNQSITDDAARLPGRPAARNDDGVWPHMSVRVPPAPTFPSSPQRRWWRWSLVAIIVAVLVAIGTTVAVVVVI